MWISIKIFQFLNFNRAFEWLEKGTMRMAFSRRHIFHSHTHMTDPPIVASHYFKEDFNSRTKQKSLEISRYVIAQFGVCGFSKKKCLAFVIVTQTHLQLSKLKKCLVVNANIKTSVFFQNPCLATSAASNLQFFETIDTILSLQVIKAFVPFFLYKI